MSIWATFSRKKTEKAVNSIFGGTPDTSSRQPWCWSVWWCPKLTGAILAGLFTMWECSTYLSQNIDGLSLICCFQAWLWRCLIIFFSNVLIKETIVFYFHKVDNDVVFQKIILNSKKTLFRILIEVTDVWWTREGIFSIMFVFLCLHESFTKGINKQPLL